MAINWRIPEWFWLVDPTITFTSWVLEGCTTLHMSIFVGLSWYEMESSASGPPLLTNRTTENLRDFYPRDTIFPYWTIISSAITNQSLRHLEDNSLFPFSMSWPYKIMLTLLVWFLTKFRFLSMNFVNSVFKGIKELI